MVEKGNPEYVVWLLRTAAGTVLSVYKKGVPPLRGDSCVYRVKGDEGVIRRNYHELICVMQLVGKTLPTNDVRADLDRESILAVVPQWEKVI